MRSPRVDDFVRLRQDVPEVSLARGEVGIVCSTWFAPAIAYEVEFHQMGHDYQTRVLLQPDEVEVDDDVLTPDHSASMDSEVSLGWG